MESGKCEALEQIQWRAGGLCGTVRNVYMLCNYFIETYSRIGCRRFHLFSTTVNTDSAVGGENWSYSHKMFTLLRSQEELYFQRLNRD